MPERGGYLQVSYPLSSSIPTYLTPQGLDTTATGRIETPLPRVAKLTPMERVAPKKYNQGESDGLALGSRTGAVEKELPHWRWVDVDGLHVAPPGGLEATAATSTDAR